jgi:hypothetical protein
LGNGLPEKMAAVKRPVRGGSRENGSESTRIPRARTRLVSLDDLDGRTHAAKQAFELRDQLLSERGGPERLGAIKIALCESVALLTAMIVDAQARWLRGEPIDPSTLATLVNARRREAEAVGIDPKPLDAMVPTLDEYLRQQASA